MLTGSIVDANTRAPLTNVIVTATSSALQGEQVAISDRAGVYRFSGLRPGEYAIRCDAEAYRPYVRDGILLRADSTIQVDVQLLPEALEAEQAVVVVAEAPSVDIGSTSTGMNIDAETMRRVPLSRPGSKGSAARSFESVADSAPGAVVDEYGTSINGATSPENQYIIDGLRVNDPAYAINGLGLSIEFIKEFNVITGGYLPEYGRSTGGVLNVVTKSGSNELHGSLFGHFTPGGLQGSPRRVLRQGAGIETDLELDHVLDSGFDVGAPVIHDKLWFYGGFVHFKSKWQLKRQLNRLILDAHPDNAGEVQPRIDPSTGLPITAPLPGTERFYEAEERGFHYLGKLTYAIDRDNDVSLSGFGVQSSSGGDGAYSIDPRRGVPEQTELIGTYEALAHRRSAWANALVATYSRALASKTTLVDVTLGWYHQRGSILPVDGSSIGSQSGLAGQAQVEWNRSVPGPHSSSDFAAERTSSAGACAPQGTNQISPCPVSQYYSGGPGHLSELTLDRYLGKLTLTKIFEAAGHHVLKAGVELEETNYANTSGYSGGRVLSESDDGTLWFESRGYGFLTAPDRAVSLDKVSWDVSSITVGGFIQDSFSIRDSVTLNVGMRYDVQLLYANTGRVAMVLPNQWSPRLGTIYDVTGNGRSKLYASYARYYEGVPLDVAQRVLSRESQLFSALDAAACDPSDITSQKTACRDDTNRIPLQGAESPDQRYIQVGGTPTPIDPDLEAESSDEIVLGAEYELIPRGRLGLSYLKRSLNRAIEDMSRDEAYTYFIGNPGYGIARDFPQAKREYDAVTLYFQKTWSERWLAHGSYTLSFLRGNYVGLFQPETAQLNPNNNSTFDLQSLVVNGEGYLPGDHRHQMKVFAAKELSVGRRVWITPGFSLHARSGAPTSYLGRHLLYGANEVYILPRGSGERLPWVVSIDPHFGYAVALAPDKTFEVTVDVFNLFNFQAATAVDETFTNSAVQPIEGGGTGAVAGCRDPNRGTCQLRSPDGAPIDSASVNPNFGQPTEYQPPRTFRFGARLSF